MTAHRSTNAWPSLRVHEWTPTRETLHMWTQIVGKIRLAHAPMVNHWWQVTLYVTPRGLTTSAIPYGNEVFDIEFDFIDHQLVIRSSTGATRTVQLEPKSVADFYAETMQTLAELGFPTRIQSHPNEVDPAPGFAEDVEHASYDPDAANLFWRQLIQAHRVLSRFRSRFAGKVSPVHFFWGAMDIACTRFSGRGAPRHPGGAPNLGDWVMAEGYSRELSSCGFWPGGGDEGAFYAYAYPEPDGFAGHAVTPEQAYYSKDHGEYLLPYEVVRQAADPDQVLLGFLQDTYEAVATRAEWDRALLEEDPDRWKKRDTRS
ncbi:DUF5996 family protein [Mycobacterium persicum]|uniref:Ava_C0101 and related proteins n=1 Tax=Mycobacterium persicum TaxID=1487726 RepID=A0A1X0LGS3_9MYCO|nr:DUF5996 family protein [Mycobacterium persicum]KZS81027.1 hypothetical protein A4G31_07800 [Mycobacterium persicum]ORB34745.1 hypothetical protein BST40_25300 [Mycobacterium persicum]ORB92705.1 hypothetical protein B1T49_08375 [Mycobacterium persicum]ORB98122.1 hypothetical protein B1T44_09510 [Mycobacterium persicum]ORC04804.1 hypothetical protein B1T48_08970 [Mycobacterium persicum]